MYSYRRNPEEDFQKAFQAFQASGSEEDRDRLIAIVRRISPLCQDPSCPYRAMQEPQNWCLDCRHFAHVGRVCGSFLAGDILPHQCNCKSNNIKFMRRGYQQLRSQDPAEAAFRDTLGLITNCCSICFRFLCYACEDHPSPRIGASKECIRCNQPFSEEIPVCCSSGRFCDGSYDSGICINCCDC